MRALGGATFMTWGHLDPEIQPNVFENLCLQENLACGQSFFVSMEHSLRLKGSVSFI